MDRPGVFDPPLPPAVHAAFSLDTDSGQVVFTAHGLALRDPVHGAAHGGLASPRPGSPVGAASPGAGGGGRQSPAPSRAAVRAANGGGTPVGRGTTGTPGGGGGFRAVDSSADQPAAAEVLDQIEVRFALPTLSRTAADLAHAAMLSKGFHDKAMAYVEGFRSMGAGGGGGSDEEFSPGVCIASFSLGAEEGEGGDVAEVFPLIWRPL